MNMHVRNSGTADALHSDGPAADRADKMALYGGLIGDWEMDCGLPPGRRRDPQGPGRNPFRLGPAGPRHPGRLAFSRSRPGRPRRSVEKPMYGTTLRVYDPGIDAWHILWSDPVRQFYTRQIGRARDSDIVQPARMTPATLCAGASPRSRPIRSAGLGERSRDDGKTWHLQADFRARRKS